MKLVAYLRVSTDRQAEHGLGLEVQRQSIRGWARTNGHRVMAYYTDSGVSGSNGIEHREALGDALTSLRDGRASGLVVARLDRLARALTVQEAILGKAWSFGATVFTVDGGEVHRDDPDDPMRSAMRQMAGVFAELERKLITKRLRDGRKAKADAGGFATGSPPYGWRAENGELVEVPAEQAALQRMLGLRAEGASLRDIARTLESEGHKTKRGGTRWHVEVLRHILQRQAGS